MRIESRKRMAMSGLLGASMVCGAGMLITPIGLAAAAQDAPTAEELPSGAEVIEKYVEATGGAEAYENRKTMVTKAKMEMAGMGQSVDLTIYQTAPNKMVTVVTLPGMGDQTTVYDGESGWSESAMAGPRLLTEEEISSMKRQAAFDAQHRPEKYYETIETVGRTEFAGETAYEVVLKPEGEQETIKQFYSVESGLLLGQAFTQATQQGDIEVRVLMSDYREVGGLKMPFQSTLEYPGMGMSQTLTISSIEIDAEIGPEVFTMPEEIKALKDQQDAEG